MLASGFCRRCLTQLSRRQSSVYTRKKVYKHATVSMLSESAGFAVKLDEQPLRTPCGNEVIVPSEMAASAMAREWSIQEEVLKPHMMPLTQLINLAIDQPTSRSAEEMAKDMLAYLETDTLRCRVEFPDELVTLQNEKWDPILKWFEERFQVEVPSTAVLLGMELSESTQSSLTQYIANLNKWTRTSLESAATSSKSFATASALLEDRVDVEEAISISQLENMFQINRWGNVEWAHQYDLVGLKSSLSAAYLMHSWCGKASETST